MIKCSTCQQYTDVGSNCDKTKPNHTTMRRPLDRELMFIESSPYLTLCCLTGFDDVVNLLISYKMVLQDKNCTHNQFEENRKKGINFAEDPLYYWSNSKKLSYYKLQYTDADSHTRVMTMQSCIIVSLHMQKLVALLSECDVISYHTFPLTFC